MTIETVSAERPAENGFNRKISEFIKRVEYRRLEKPEELEEAYSLRYKSYRRENLIAESPEQRFEDHLDTVDNTHIFGLYLDQKIISSIRLHVLDKNNRQSPSLLVFEDKLRPMLNDGKVIVDPSRFCTDYEASRKYRALPYATLRLAGMAVLYFNADHCLTMVRNEHAAFYKKIYNSVQIGETRPYKSVNFQVALYCADAKIIRANVARRYPFFKANLDEIASLFVRKNDSATA